MTPLIIDTIAVILTLLVLSRIIGDNPLFRVAQYLFVGISLGYAFVVIYHQVLLPSLIHIVTGLNRPIAAVSALIPFLIGLLLLPRIIGRQSLSWLANIPLGIIFGVGAALALSGAMLGTIKPQILGTIAFSVRSAPQDIVGSILMALGVILVLSYFYFTVPEKVGLMRISQVSARLGRWLLMITFGFFLAGALLTYLIALNERIEFLINWVHYFL